MPLKVTWGQALAWRMRRHMLDPIGSQPFIGGAVAFVCHHHARREGQEVVPLVPLLALSDARVHTVVDYAYTR